MESSEDDGKLMEALEQILSTLRHEIGNPVNSMKITLNVFREKMDRLDREKTREYIDRCLRLVARQERLVEAMKRYVLVDAGNRDEIFFPDFWGRLVDSVSARMRSRNIRFFHYLDAGPCRIRADRTALGVVMGHILDNAVEAVSDTRDPEIMLKAGRDGDCVEMRVEDNGPGIHGADMRRVFVPLFTTRPGGMGMGLPIARRLVFRMGGRLAIENLRGRGTGVSVRLGIVPAGEGERGPGEERVCRQVPGHFCAHGENG